MTLKKRHILLIWFALNIIQAIITPLHPDEAYYWLYAQQLDWGYFDHPPMVALGIWLFQWIPGTLGVRMATIILSTATLWVFNQWVEESSPKTSANPLMWMLVFPLVHAYGFIATPDAPLFFFGAVFWWKISQLSIFSWKKLIVLGVVMSGLLYSKYHGVLLIGIVGLLKKEVWRNPAWYGAGLLGVCLFLPHLYWQWENDFPSIKYHLQDRNEGFQLRFLIEFLLNSFFIFHPWIWIQITKNRIHDWKINRIPLGFIILFFGFFFLSVFKGQVQPQWTLLAILPMAYIAAQWDMSQKIRKRVWGFSIGIIIIGRLLLPIIPNLGFANNRLKAEELEQKVQGRNAIFSGSFQEVSLYAFYHHTTNVHLWSYRKTQFDLWRWDLRFKGPTWIQSQSDSIPFNK